VSKDSSRVNLITPSHSAQEYLELCLIQLHTTVFTNISIYLQRIIFTQSSYDNEMPELSRLTGSTIRICCFM
jgi:hypothetical protein